MIAVATTSGTGSEITNISVLTDLSKNVKSTMNDPLMYPKAATNEYTLKDGVFRCMLKAKTKSDSKCPLEKWI